MGLISTEDLEYYAQQSKGNINMIISGMTALMNDNDEKIQQMESQNWFKRMTRTIFGKNKATKREIQQNHDKINAYMSEAIAELFNRGCIQEEMIMSLGLQINELYSDHLQLKSMLGAFACKLNDKIESVDNYHMLITEIEQGVYSSFPQIVAICKILSLLDKRVIEDERKLDILRRSVEQKGLITEDQINLSDYLLDIIDIDQDEIGLIYMEIQNLKGNYLSDIILDTIESYFFLSDMNKKLADKKMIVENLIKNRGLEASIQMSTAEIYDDFINSKIDVNNGLIPISEIQIEGKIKEAEEMYLKCDFDLAFEIFKSLAEKGSGRAMYFLNEYYRHGYGHVVRDVNKANEWVLKGAEEGDVLSQYMSAFVYSKDSIERKKIFEEIFPSVKDISERGDINAIYELALIYKDGNGVEKSQEKYWQKINEAADLGHWKALLNIGYAYYTDNEIGIDYDKAMKYFSMASDMGYGDATYWLADMYYEGKGVSQNFQKAYEIYEKGIEQGEGECANRCGQMYYREEGVTTNRAKELEMYFKGVELGSANAAANLGYSYEMGNGVEKNLDEAYKWYRIGAERGNIRCMYDIGDKARLDKQYEDALKWLTKAAEKNHAGAQNSLALMYSEGEGVEKDMTRAFQLFLKSAENNYLTAQRNVAICYKNGEGCEKDIEKSKEWLRKAADQGHEKSIISLSEWFGEGTGVVSNNDTCRVAGLMFGIDTSERTMEDVKMFCDNFVFMNDLQRKFENTYKLRNGLGIPSYETVYIAHDDTIWGSGKNGFAITDNGIYCRGFMGSTIHTDFLEFANADEIVVKGSEIYADNNMIAYFTDSAHIDELKFLFCQIQMAIRKY